MLAKKFEEQVSKTPGNIAVKDGEKTFTYEGLNRYANSIARLVLESAAGDVVGLLFEHGVSMIAAVLGALKAGKIYVPLSVDYPFNRLSYMLSDSESSLILTNIANESSARRLGGENNIPVKMIDGIGAADSVGNPAREVFRQKPTYILYTSGSTGKPKGVVQTHENADYYNRNWVRKFSITPSDRMTLFSSFCHDGSVQDMFSALHSGAALYPLNMKNRETTIRLSEFLSREKITIWHSVPSLFSFFANTLDGSETFPDLRFILLGGEPVRQHEVEMFNRHFPHSTLANVYGQTESSVNSVCLIEHGSTYKKPLIGTPLDRTEIFVIDDNGEPVEPLETGEILVACPYLSPGYWKNPEGADKRFKDDEEFGRLYWTGDLGRLLVDGNIEFLGRGDFQVKIRGFRVELGEIESQLLKHPGIKEAVVTAGEDDSGDTYLCAYVVEAGSVDRNPGPLHMPQLREFLAGELPDYMIPTYFVPVKAMPLTPSGKIDRKALPQPDGVETGKEYTAPRDAIEKKLVELWSQVLNIDKEKIGIDAGFFQLGGHSLKATILVSKMHKVFNVRIPLARIFKTPTIRGLSEFIKEAEEERYASVSPVEKREFYTLSSSQKRLYMLRQLDTETVAYNLPNVVILEGKLDREKLEETFHRLIARHESFRTSFEMIAGEPVQKIHQQVEFEIQYFLATEAVGDRSLEIEADSDTYLSSVIRRLSSEFIRPFDLAEAPLIRVGLIRAADAEYILITDIHHIVCDGISYSLFYREAVDMYSGEELPSLKLQYKDFSQWQNTREYGDAKKVREKYWMDVFSDELPIVNLPLDFPRPAVQSFAGSSMDFEIGKEETEDLRAIAENEGSTLYMVLLAIMNVLSMKLSGQEDIVIGSPVGGRVHTDLHRLIGMFVNTVVLRNYPTAEKTFATFLTELKERVLPAFENQEYPFENLVDKVTVGRDLSRNPIFDIMFILINEPQESSGRESETQKGDLELIHYKLRKTASQFDMTFSCFERSDMLAFRVEYCTKLFKEETIHRFISYFKKIVASVSQEPGQKLSQVEIMSDDERHRLLSDFNDTGVQYPKDKTIHQLFEEQVEKTPAHTAVIGGEQAHITYRELNKESNRLAQLLRSRGVKPGTIVGIMVERCEAMMAGLLGILKAGGAYLPIDPGYPESRIDYMLADSVAKLLLTRDTFDKTSVSSVANKQPATRNSQPATRLAYIIYTSGSTGKPKGVMIRHKNVVNFIKGMTWQIGFSPGKTILALTTISFDIFLLETLLPVTCGLKVVVADETQQKDPLLLKDVIVRQKVNILQVTPSRLQLLLSLKDDLQFLAGVEQLLVGGEAFPVHLFEALREKFRGKIYNVYGPTETTIWSTVKDLSNCRSEELNIGSPTANTRVYIVNRQGLPQPVGTAGELLIGGDGVAAGYLNNVELTVEKFIFYHGGDKVKIENLSLYKTGDLARWLPDGEIEFLGRIDYQVKIRGFRIELGEIEEQLQAYDNVKEAVVIDKESRPGDRYLCAYLVPSGDTIDPSALFDAARLREFLSGKLPDYMIPSYFVPLEKIPLTPNGKIDRKALPEPEFEAGENYVAPENEIEKKLARIWSEILGIEKDIIGIDANFFELGGHSLRAINVLAKIHEEFNIKTTLTQIFKTPTIRGLSGVIKGAEEDKYASISPVERKEFYSLSSTQKRLYMLQQLDTGTIAYNLSNVVILEGKLDREKLEETFHRLIARHESFRTSFIMVEKAGGVVQRIHDPREVECEIEFYDFIGTQVKVKVENFIRPFDPGKAPLLRLGLIKPEENKHILMLDIHHITADGTSQGLLVKEFMALYKNGEELDPLIVQYKDYSEWQNNRSGNEIERLKNREAFWLKELGGEIPVLNLPVDFERPETHSLEGRSLRFEINKGESEKLRQVANEEGVSLFVLFLAIYTLLISKITGQEDILIGTQVAGRQRRELQNIIGVFINTLVLRNYPRKEKTFKGFLKEVMARTLDAFENQDYPFEDLAEKIVGIREVSRNPLFDVMFVWQNMEMEEIRIPGLALKPYREELEKSRALLDLSIYGYEEGEHFLFYFEYNTSLFKQETIERFIAYFKEIITSVITDKEIKVNDIRISHQLAAARSKVFRESDDEFGF